jgi:hypothetical protein
MVAVLGGLFVILLGVASSIPSRTGRAVAVKLKAK